MLSAECQSPVPQLESDDADSCLAPCIGCAEAAGRDGGYLSSKLDAVDDVEGARLPEGLPPVIDAHVHLFPPPLCDALWRWFDRWGWPIRYRLYADAVVRFMLDRGVEHLVALIYAHKAGIADGLNRFMAELCTRYPEVTGLATVMPNEPDAVGILERAFALGLRGVKLHCHVQCFAPDETALHDIYACCVKHDLPLVMHAGREPRSPGYACDPHVLCAAERIDRVLDDYPTLRLCVPHLGADEFDAYTKLLQRHDNLWLDTTMVMAGFFSMPDPVAMLRVRPERVLYGTDFPNIPYAWDREVNRILERELSADELDRLLGRTARELYGVGDARKSAS
jgi:predicted TIM-barrel fold metal-dependent hydrolase